MFILNKEQTKEALAAHKDQREQERLEGTLPSQKVRKNTEKVATRATSGTIYAVLIVACLLLGPVACAVMVAIMGWLCASELFRMARMSGRMPNEFLGLAAALLFPASVLMHPVATQGLIVLLIVFTGLWYVMTLRATIADVALTIFTPLYTSWMLSAVVSIRAYDTGWQGFLLAFGVMGSVWVNDMFAFFVGSRFGKHKLAPKISPHKTWEGLIGGLIGSVFIWMLFVVVGVCNITIPLALIGGVTCGLAGVLGDLFESRIKRGVGVKDAGNLIPGHGGLLDRSDSMIFASMCALVVLKLGGIL